MMMIDRRYHHASILTLMGVCQTEDLEGVALVYEHVACGSLYTFLHHKVCQHSSHCHLASILLTVLLWSGVYTFMHCVYTKTARYRHFSRTAW